MMGFRKRVWREQHGSNGSTLTDLPFQLTWETIRKQPCGEGILTNFTGGRYGASLGDGSPAERVSRTVSDLERILAGAEGMPVGRLYFAGEHRSLHAQGYMEGGCETGERAAAEILQALRRGSGVLTLSG